MKASGIVGTIFPRVAASFATALLILVLALPATAQVANDPRRDNDPIVIPPSETELVYRRFEGVPPQLRTVLRCAETWLSDFPIRVIRPDPTSRRMIVLAPCGSIVNQGIAFTIGRYWQPEPIEFIVAIPPRGLQNVRNPGRLDWHADTGTLTAVWSTDVCPSDEARHSYRYNGSESPFTLLRIERRQKEDCAGSQPWSLLWESPDWLAK
jgi:hypothetical protein